MMRLPECNYGIIKKYFVQAGKGQQSASERSNFFILCVIQNNYYGKNFIEGNQHKSAKRI